MPNPYLYKTIPGLIARLRRALVQHDRHPDNPVLHRTIFLLIDALIQKGHIQRVGSFDRCPRPAQEA
ncbi:MAG: hypothetical protein OZSIB_0445 [Candidatus Ozemobacter sibiricus]|jgi:hypothetical protein|uniref:Uncharacterized protein n=1 Tax=Candidatus Ozemobacter sibiricus TaxID=2268124 RepID=A0A367ZLW9_9BACT|nr:MAG: hypothetical protein OZSIB_0445 [Candidatus Ozemobacter sibiricus]